MVVRGQHHCLAAFPLERAQVQILQEAGKASGPPWTNA